MEAMQGSGTWNLKGRFDECEAVCSNTYHMIPN